MNLYTCVVKVDIGMQLKSLKQIRLLKPAKIAYKMTKSRSNLRVCMIPQFMYSQVHGTCFRPDAHIRFFTVRCRCAPANPAWSAGRHYDSQHTYVWRRCGTARSLSVHSSPQFPLPQRHRTQYSGSQCIVLCT